MLIDSQLLAQIQEHNDATPLPPLLVPLKRTLQDRAALALAQTSLRERWKYSRAKHYLDSWDTTAVGPEGSINITESSGLNAQRIAEIAADSDAANYVSSHLADPTRWLQQPIADLVTTSGADGWVIDVAAGTQGELELALAAGHGFVMVRLNANAQLSLRVRYTDTQSPLRHWLQVDMGSNSKLDTNLVLDSTAQQRLLLCQVELAQGANWQGQQQILTSGGRQRLDTIAHLRGDHAAVDLRGAAVAVGGASVDQQVEINHRLPNANSQQRFHTATGAKATNTFNGRIHIAENAARSDAQLSNRNLLLAPDAVVNAKPELEIYADDVSCSHGATIGALDEQILHYLRSRGLDANGAKQLLIKAFIKECLYGSTTDAVAQRAMQLLATTP